MVKKQKPTDPAQNTTVPGAELNQDRWSCDIQSMAIEVFGNPADAQRWLKTPHPAFGNAPPLSYAVDEPKVKKVLGVLAGLRHGGVA